MNLMITCCVEKVLVASYVSANDRDFEAVFMSDLSCITSLGNLTFALRTAAKRTERREREFKDAIESDANSHLYI